MQPSPSFQANISSQTKTSPRQKRHGTYLYLKSNTYYFRYAFTAQQKAHFARTEIRMSLRTGFLNLAKRLARNLYITLENLLMDGRNTLTYTEVRQKLILQLQELLDSYPVKKNISIVDIQERMAKVLHNMLLHADNTLYRPEKGVLSINGQYDYVTPEETLDHMFHVFYKNTTNSPNMLLAQHFPQAIIELLQLEVFNPEELTEFNILKILNEYHKLQINFNRIMLAREKGDYTYEKNFTIENTNYSDTIQIEKTPTKVDERLLCSAFIEKYIVAKLSDKHWKEHSVPTHRNRLHVLIDILGDKDIQDFSRENIRHLRDTLLKLPPNYKKSSLYKGKTIDQILEMPQTSSYSIKTVNITIESIASMLEWGVREGYLDKNNAKSLQIKDERQEISLKSAFTPDDIQKIFFSGDFSAQKFVSPTYYWVPLIGLYTGMRLEEICQLYCDDISKDGEVWFIDVNLTTPTGSTDTKLLKNKNAQRQIPIHQDLLDFGLIDYIQHVCDAGHERIFFDLKKTQSSPKLGKNVGKTFSRYLSKINFPKENKSFHSLRHTFSDYFKIRNLHTDIFKQIFGHAITDLASNQYGSKFSVQQCYNDIISKIDWHHTLNV